MYVIPLLHIFTNTCYIFSIVFNEQSCYLKWYLTMVLTYLSLMRNVAVHFLMCSLAICISS